MMTIIAIIINNIKKLLKYYYKGNVYKNNKN